MIKYFKKNGFEFTYVEDYKVVGIEDGEYDIVVTNITDEQNAKDAINILTEVMTMYVKLNHITYDELVELHKSLK